MKDIVIAVSTARHKECDLCHYPEVNLAVASIKFGLGSNLVRGESLCVNHLRELHDEILSVWTSLGLADLIAQQALQAAARQGESVEFTTPINPMRDRSPV